MESLSLEKYKEIRLRELHDLEKNVASWSELRFVLNESWFKRVKAVINNWDDRLKVDDGAYNLFRILSEDLSPIILNKRLVKVEALSREQSKLRSYRKTRGELASTQTNQILGSLFEINILYAAVQSCSSVEVFPKVGKGGSDVEARLIVDTRPLFIEVKALTYSKHDVSTPYNGYVATHPVNSMVKQIYDAVNEKLAKGKQLQILSENFPTVLFLALGFNADEISGPWGIELYYQEQQSNISSVFIFGSALCRNQMKAFPNEFSSFYLSGKELEFFENNFCKVLVDNSSI
jgi:hypothetical protein